MPVFKPNDSSVISINSINMDMDFTGVDDSSIETYHSTWKNHGKMSATITLESQPDVAEMLTEWAKPPVNVSALIPKNGIKAAIAQFIHGLLPTSLKHLAEHHAYDVYEFPDMKRGEPYQNKDGEWVVPFHK